MTYLYAGLGIAMLLPIMAGFQLAIAMSELQSSNNSIVLSNESQSQQERQQENQYLDSENLQLQEAIKTVNAAGGSVDCTFPIPAGLSDEGFVLSQIYSSACSFTSERPFPYPYNDGIERKARLYVELSGSGTTSVTNVIDQCLVTTATQRCGLEQEKQAA